MTIGVIWDDVPPESSLTTVISMAEAYRRHRCDAIVAVGGGSVIDSAKGMNIAVTEDQDDIASLAGSGVLPRPMVAPLLVVPTTAGTGSETTSVAVILDPARGVKVMYVSPHLYPRVAILDPRMTMTLPARLTAATGMDALGHAIEAYTCLQKNPMSDAYAWEAVHLIGQHLVPVLRAGAGAEGRLALTNASCMAGIAFSNSMVGLAHSLAHAAGSVCHLSHGTAVSIFLPHALAYNLDLIRLSLGELLLPFSGPVVYAATPPDRRGLEMIQAIRALQDELYGLSGLPRTLSEAGVPQARACLPDIAAAALNDGALTYNPLDLDRDQMIEVLERAA
jgi:alcohol dehydrogenase